VTPAEPAGTESASSHWTYVRSKPGADLVQGDLLRKTDALRAILTEVHPHYLKDDYTHFIVLTQTCDLVRRDGAPCKARYVSLAAVRPLDLVVKRALEKFQSSDLERISNACSEKYRSAMLDFLRKVFNNNEHDFFYLHEDVTFGLTPSSCAFLQLSIALRAWQHYPMLLEARIGSLSEIFGAKLGWLVGNLYSRVGTEDWVPEHETKMEFNERLHRVLDDSCWWVEEEQLKTAIKNATPELLARGPSAIREHVKTSARTPRRERLLLAIERILIANGVSQDTARATVGVLRSDPEIKSLMPK